MLLFMTRARTKGVKEARVARGGPFTLFTPARREVILNAIRAGNFLKTAASLAGVSREALTMWMRLGRKHPEGPYGKFCVDLQNASAAAEADLVANIRTAATSEWPAAAFLLTHGRSKRNWKKVQKTEQSITGTVKIENVHLLSDGDLEALAKILEKTGGQTVEGQVIDQKLLAEGTPTPIEEVEDADEGSAEEG